MSRDVVDELRQMDRLKSPNLRGMQFERILADAFEQAGFDVKQRDTRVARGRECDVVASKHGRVLLVEAKWHDRRLGRQELDHLFERLREAPPKAIGCFFSRTGFTRGFIAAVEQDIDHTIILFRGEELLHLLGDPVRLQDSIERKLQNQRGRRKACFETVELGEPQPASPASLRGSAKLVTPKGALPYVSCRLQGTSASSAIMHARHLTDIEPTRLELLPQVHDERGLIGLLATLKKKLGMSLDGACAVHGTEAAWYGVGAQGLATALAQSKQRYKETPMRGHHSEEFTYIAPCQLGSVAVNGRHRLTRDFVVDSVEVTIHMPGIPADARTFEELRRAVGAHRAFFTVAHEYTPTRVFVPRASQLRLEVVAEVVDSALDKEESVVGIVVENPFVGRRRLPRIEGSDGHAVSEHLRAASTLMCDLSDWHDPGDVADYYYLEGIRVHRVAGVLCLQPRATWHELVRRSGPPYPRTEERKQIARDWIAREAFEESLRGKRRRKPDR